MAARTRKGQSGFGLSEFIVALFQKNETARLTDPQIAQTIRDEFGRDPGRQYLRNISHLRCLYNRGVFTQGKPPKRKAKRYDEQGRIMVKGKRYRGGSTDVSAVASYGLAGSEGQG